MPIVYCPACGQEALVFIGGPPQRTCSTCEQVFWTSPKPSPAPKREPRSQRREPNRRIDHGRLAS